MTAASKRSARLRRRRNAPGSTAPVLAVWMLWSFGGLLRADLAWEQKTLTINPAVADTVATAHFRFRNTGASAVAIKSVTAACSCVAVVASQPSFAPGESGEIVAKFTIGDRVGPQKTEVAVETGDGAASPTLLTLEIVVPKIAELEPDPLRWLPGDSLNPKRIHITARKGVTMRPTAVKSSDPGVSARIESGQKEGEFEVVVTPRGDHRTFSGSLTIETDFPKDHPKALIAHIQVAP